jgi:hypothetical protein
MLRMPQNSLLQLNFSYSMQLTRSAGAASSARGLSRRERSEPGLCDTMLSNCAWFQFDSTTKSRLAESFAGVTGTYPQTPSIIKEVAYVPESDL